MLSRRVHEALCGGPHTLITGSIEGRDSSDATELPAVAVGAAPGSGDSAGGGVAVDVVAAGGVAVDVVAVGGIDGPERLRSARPAARPWGALAC